MDTARSTHLNWRASGPSSSRCCEQGWDVVTQPTKLDSYGHRLPLLGHMPSESLSWDECSRRVGVICACVWSVLWSLMFFCRYWGFQFLILNLSNWFMSLKRSMECFDASWCVKSSYNVNEINLSIKKNYIGRARFINVNIQFVPRGWLVSEMVHK